MNSWCDRNCFDHRGANSGANSGAFKCFLSSTTAELPQRVGDLLGGVSEASDDECPGSGRILPSRAFLVMLVLKMDAPHGPHVWRRLALVGWGKFAKSDVAS
jgi:hypothetical protein